MIVSRSCQWYAIVNLCGIHLAKIHQSVHWCNKIEVNASCLGPRTRGCQAGRQEVIASNCTLSILVVEQWYIHDYCIACAFPWTKSRLRRDLVPLLLGANVAAWEKQWRNNWKQIENSWRSKDQRGGGASDSRFLFNCLTLSFLLLSCVRVHRLALNYSEKIKKNESVIWNKKKSCYRLHKSHKAQRLRFF